MSMKLLSEDELENSSIVVNSLMNRERRIIGRNSYSKELGLNILEYIDDKVKEQEVLNWLDIGCGSGRALIEAAKYFHDSDRQNKIDILGIDLVNMFNPKPADLTNLSLMALNIIEYKPNKKFDLITCIHGLHYIGDKLKLIENIVNWIAEQGLFIANIDLDNFRDSDNNSIKRLISKKLKLSGIIYNSRKHIISVEGSKTINFKYQFIGADENAGPNYTKQAVVNSVYLLL